MIVVAYTSFCDGQVTRFSSLRTSVRNVRLRFHQPVTFSLASPMLSTTFVAISASSFQLSNRAPNSRLAAQSSSSGPASLKLEARSSQLEANLAGQEGLEPPAPGFGDRCSNN